MVKFGGVADSFMCLCRRSSLVEYVFAHFEDILVKTSPSTEARQTIRHAIKFQLVKAYSTLTSIMIMRVVVVGGVGECI